MTVNNPARERARARAAMATLIRLYPPDKSSDTQKGKHPVQIMPLYKIKMQTRLHCRRSEFSVYTPAYIRDEVIYNGDTLETKFIVSSIFLEELIFNRSI